MLQFAVVQTGGKQYKIAPGQKIRVEKLNAEEGSRFLFESVLLKVNGEEVKIGTPYISGEKVEAKILEQGRDKKKIIFRYHSKTRYRKKKGHRQPFTELEIVSI